MKPFVLTLIATLVMLLTACGGGGGTTFNTGGTPGTTVGAVALAGQNQLVTFSETSKGTLTTPGGSPLTATGSTTACAADPANAFVLAAYDNGLLTSYQIASNGGATQVSTGLINGLSPAMAELGGKLVYVAENNTGLTQFGVFSLSATGVLQSLPNQLTSAEVLDVVAHPNGQTLVASLNPSSLQVYRADAVSGALTPLTVPLQGFGGGAAHTMAFVQNGAFLLVVENVTPNFPVDLFSVNATTGALVRLSTVLNVTGTQLLAAHPNGRTVYAVGTSSITPVFVDPNGVGTIGTTTQIPGFTATAATVDHSGANLFVTGANGAVASFAIDATTGALTTNSVAAATVNFAPVCVVAK